MLEQKLNDGLCSMFYMTQADLSANQVEVQHNLESLQADWAKDHDVIQELIQTLQIRQATDHEELKSILGML